MNAVLVDSNVLLKVLGEDPLWHGWSSEALARCAGESVLAINPVIYAEASIRFRSIEELHVVLSAQYFERLALPWEAALLAGKAFATYRRRRGPRVMALPDFHISGCRP